MESQGNLILFSVGTRSAQTLWYMLIFIYMQHFSLINSSSFRFNLKRINKSFFYLFVF